MMPFSFSSLPKDKVVLVVSMLGIFAAVGVANIVFRDVPEGRRFDLPSAHDGGVTLKGRGDLPALHGMMAQDPALAEMIRRLGEIPPTQFFTRQNDINLTIVDTLFRWAGADLVPQGLYGPYIDSRVVAFLKKTGAVPPTVAEGAEIEMTQAGTLNEQWFNVFEYYRIRLLAQLSGKGVYDGKVLYDLGSDRIIVNGPISPDFIQAFQTELKVSNNSGEAMRALLDFIDSTKGFSALSDAEQDLIMSLDAAQPQETAAEPVPPASAP